MTNEVEDGIMYILAICTFFCGATPGVLKSHSWALLRSEFTNASALPPLLSLQPNPFGYLLWRDLFKSVASLIFLIEF